MARGDRVWIDTRVSSKGQAKEDRYSLTDQAEACREKAEREGWVVVEVHADAWDSEDRERPGLQKLLAAARSGEIDVVLAHTPDRLARGDVLPDWIYAELSFVGVRLDFVLREYPDDATLPLFPLQPPRSARELLADHVTAMVCCAAMDTAGATPGLDWLDGPTLLLGGERAADLAPRVLSLIEDGDPGPLRAWLVESGIRPEKPVRLV